MWLLSFHYWVSPFACSPFKLVPAESSSTWNHDHGDFTMVALSEDNLLQKCQLLSVNWWNVEIDVMEANSGGLAVQRIRVSTCILCVIPMWICFQEANRVENYFSLTFWRQQGASWSKDRRWALSYWSSICQTKIFIILYIFFLLFMAWNWHWATCWQIIPGKALSTP